MATHADEHPLTAVRHYYASHLAEHGATARGVDWNGEASQSLRFKQLLRIVDDHTAFSLNDLGCGYGACLAYMTAAGLDCDYLGIDIVPEMITAARAIHREQDHCRFEVGKHFGRCADYTVASGIFNVSLDVDKSSWQQLILETLDAMDASSSRGFAFNCLTAYADPDKMRPQLHYADPLSLFDYCKRHYARNVALLHDYDLYEFTILVRKSK